MPLEAQRLGLESYASDLNPVAVLINKAMIEIPPKFAGRPPVNPRARSEKSLDPRQWHGAQGLAEDVRYYGEWMRDEAEKRIGHLYPKVEITAEMAKERPDLKPLVGRKLTVIAWLWARTVKSPNPAFAQVDVPLASTFMLSTKPGKERSRWSGLSSRATSTVSREIMSFTNGPLDVGSEPDRPARETSAENCEREITEEMIGGAVSVLRASPWVVEKTPRWALRELAQELLEEALNADPGV